MLVAILTIAVLGVLLVAPQLWVRSVLKRHGVARPEFRGTGGELARHLLDQEGLVDVKVEACAPGADHYDPEARAVRLSPEHFEGRSVAAVTIAAHEVGHALQHRDGDRALMARVTWARDTVWVRRVAFAVLASAPVIAIFVRSPLLFALQLAAGAMLLLVEVLMHAVTLPTEVDASFRRALPTLRRGGYLDDADMPAAREVLLAAAMTYVAGALWSALNVLRWLR